jgi:hypothetical protein
VNDPGELKIEQEAQPDGPDLVRCWLQQTPARPSTPPRRRRHKLKKL